MCDVFSPAIFIKMRSDFILNHNRLPRKAVLARHHVVELLMFTFEKTAEFKNKLPPPPEEVFSFFGIPIEIGDDLTIAHIE